MYKNVREEMFVLFNIFSCVVFGLLLALVLSGGLVLLMIKLFAPVRIKPISWILLLSMTILVCYQSVLLVGGFYAKGYVNDIGNGISTFIDASRITIGEVNSSLQSNKQVLENLAEEYPMLQTYILDVDVDEYVNSGLSVPSIIVEELNAMVNFYILRRVLWMLAFLLIGTFVIANCRTPYRSSNSLGGSFPMDFD